MKQSNRKSTEKKHSIERGLGPQQEKNIFQVGIVSILEFHAKIV